MSRLKHSMSSHTVKVSTRWVNNQNVDTNKENLSNTKLKCSSGTLTSIAY